MRKHTSMLMATVLLLAAGIAQAHSTHNVGASSGPALADTAKVFKEVSAGARLGDHTVLVGDDETYPLWIVKGSEVRALDISSLVLSDVESLTPIAENEFILTCSQVLSEDGTYKKKRSRLAIFRFPEGLDGTANTVIHDGFRDDLLKYLDGYKDLFADYSAFTTKAPRKGGLSIEGTAYIPKTGVFYVGLRDGATVRGGPVIVGIKNVIEYIEKGAELEFTGVHVLSPMEGAGIRDMTVSGDKVLVLLGGTKAKSSIAPSVAWWDPAKPEELRPVPVPSLDELKNAEGVWFDAEGNLMVAIDLDSEKEGASLDEVVHGFGIPK